MGIIDRLTDKIVRRLVDGFQASLLIEEMKNVPIEFLDEEYYRHYFDRELDDRFRAERIDSKVRGEDRYVYGEASGKP